MSAAGGCNIFVWPQLFQCMSINKATMDWQGNNWDNSALLSTNNNSILVWT